MVIYNQLLVRKMEFFLIQPIKFLHLFIKTKENRLKKGIA